MDKKALLNPDVEPIWLIISVFVVAIAMTMFLFFLAQQQILTAEVDSEFTAELLIMRAVSSPQCFVDSNTELKHGDVGEFRIERFTQERVDKCFSSKQWLRAKLYNLNSKDPIKEFSPRSVFRPSGQMVKVKRYINIRNNDGTLTPGWLELEVPA